MHKLRFTVLSIFILFSFFSCQKEKVTKQVKKAVGAVWIAEPNMEYIDFALEQNIILCPIFHITDVRTTEIDSWINFIKEAQKKGAKLRICPIPDGYNHYLNTIDAVPQLAIVTRFLRLLEAEGIQPFEIILDAEGRDREVIYADIAKILQTVSIDSLNLFLDKIPSQSQHKAGLTAIQNFIDEVHVDGWKVGITTLEIVAFDPLDNDNDLERFYAIPLRGIDWDFITFQVYRSGTSMSSYYVYQVAKIAKDEFGDKAGVDIGIMGVNQLEGGGDYRSFSEWQMDVSATRAANINPDLVVGFRLDLVNTAADNKARWFEETNETPIPAAPKSDLITTFNYNYFLLQDKVLDGVR